MLFSSVGRGRCRRGVPRYRRSLVGRVAAANVKVKDLRIVKCASAQVERDLVARRVKLDQLQWARSPDSLF